MPTGIYVKSEEHKKKISKTLILKELRGDSSSRWKGGKPKCVDCDKTISYYAKKCNSCRMKKNTYGFKKGQIHKGMLGKKLSEEHKRKLLESLIGHFVSEETRKKISESRLGSKHWNWNLNREEVRYNRRNDPEYKQWRKQVYIRDDFKCKIANKDCNGHIEAHHILIWSEYPELRYNLNNGITLCHAHHPKKRAEEKQLVPYFMGLVETKV